jgi:hypothetical protein
MDTYRNKNRGEFSPDVFKDAFNISLVRIGNDSDNGSQYGGNIEATPEGTLYMGDSVDDGDFDGYDPAHPGKPSPLLESLKQLGNPDAIKVTSDWLGVGHADEYLTYAPSIQGCNTVMFYGQPLEAIKMIIDQGTDEDFARFADEFADSAIAYDPETWEVLETLDVHLTRDSLREAIAYFSHSENKDSISTDLADYNLNKTEPVWADFVKTGSMTPADFASLRGDLAMMSRFYIWANLLAQSKIQQSVEVLTASTECDQREGLPQAFMPNFDFSFDKKAVYYSRQKAHLPGMTNALILRDYAIIPDPMVELMRQRVRDIVGAHLGADHKVRFVKDSFYHDGWGEIHCGTNVVREFDLDMYIH